jgi:endonuclease YncB( thermonuclease family)
MKISFVTVVACIVLIGTGAFAQEAPAPRKSPRTPVHKEAVTDRKPSLPESRQLKGQVTVIDGEKLRVGDFSLRLFGIVPPQLSASFGPQARMALDQLTSKQTTSCAVRDRDREGRYLVVCHNADGIDIALELLKRGLAVAARGSLAGTEFETPYAAAEQNAETQKTGLWSMMVPTPVAVKTADVAQTQQNLLPPQTNDDTKHDEGDTKKEEISPSPVVNVPVISKTAAAPEAPSVASSETDFFSRYQLIITGLVMLATSMGMLGAMAIQRRIDRRTDMRALAAALRGELMAARSICLTRLKTAEDDHDISWPRLRSTLYQAYVGKLGWLGAELARRVASIYGQASDYAAYYDNADEARLTAMPKRQALQTLVEHIEEVLPNLASIEQTGRMISLPKHKLSPHGDEPKSFVHIQGLGEKIAILMRTLWVSMRDIVKQSMTPKPQTPNNDAIAEYTAMIEDEMKKFSFDHGEDEVIPTNVTNLPHTGT